MKTGLKPKQNKIQPEKWIKTELKYLILQSQKIKLYDLLCIFLRGWVREFNYAKSTVLIDRVIFASWHYEIMLWTCCYTRKGCWLARLGRVSVAVVHGWTDETAHLEYAKRKSNPRKENKWLIQNLSYVQTWRRNDWYKTFPLTWSPSGRTSSFAMAICHHVIKKSNEKRNLLKGKQLFSSRSHPKRSPTQNHFHQDRPHRKMIDKSNAKRILPKENSHFHQDRPHRKVSKKVQRKTRFT